jgi:hypothetical protein
LHRQDDAAQAEPSAIEFAQALGIDDRGAALKRALPGARRQDAAQQNKGSDEDSHARPISRRTPRIKSACSGRLAGNVFLVGKLAEKQTGCRANPDLVRRSLHVVVKRSG